MDVPGRRDNGIHFSGFLEQRANIIEIGNINLLITPRFTDLYDLMTRGQFRDDGFTDSASGSDNDNSHILLLKTDFI